MFLENRRGGTESRRHTHMQHPNLQQQARSRLLKISLAIFAAVVVIVAVVGAKLAFFSPHQATSQSQKRGTMLASCQATASQGSSACTQVPRNTAVPVISSERGVSVAFDVAFDLA